MGLNFEEYRTKINLAPYPRPELLSAAEKDEACGTLLKFLLRERGMIAAFSVGLERKRELVREHMNVRPALPLPQDILAVQDALFWTESVERGIVDVKELPQQKYGISLWQGDITRLNADGIVNAANKSLLGCFLPGHRCIDNTIHSFAGMQLRGDCARLIALQGQEEEAGEAKITRAYNLPSKYVLHSVAPMVGRELLESDRAELRSVYNSCLDLAAEAGLKSLAFCCIGTGVFNFPRATAAEIAAGAVVNWKLRHPENDLHIIFNTYLPEDTKIYESILHMM